MADWGKSRCVKWEVVYHYDDFPDVAKRVVLTDHDKLEVFLNDDRLTIRSINITYKYPHHEVPEVPEKKVRSVRELRNLQRVVVEVPYCDVLPLFYKSSM